MKSAALLLMFGVIGTVLSPAEADLNCYHCGPDHFPDCLNKHHVCHHDDEVCEFQYGGHGVSIDCKKEHECIHAPSDTSCGPGGVQIHHDCAICCTSDACVSQHIAAMQGVPLATTPAPLALGCPDKCHHENKITCILSAPVCDHEEFCEFTANHNDFKGKCVKYNEMQKCHNDSRHHNTLVCTTGHISSMQQHDQCIFCCSDSTCPLLSFIDPSYKTTALPVVTQAPVITDSATVILKPVTTSAVTQPITTTSVTQSTTTTAAINPLINGNCDDVMVTGDCVSQSYQCQTISGIRRCAKTCGLCSLIQTQFYGKGECEDQLINNECTIFKDTKDICNNTIAKYTCPVTCNLCEAILDNLVQMILSPPTTTVTMTTTTDTCVDTLVDMPCSSLSNVCNNTIAPVVCKKFCNLCDSTTSIP